MALGNDPYNLLITGVGGQGNVLASQMIGHTLVAGGLVVTIGETYGASQRGGSVTSHLRISAQSQYSPLIPTAQAHLIMGLEPMEALRSLATYGNPQVGVLTNTRPIQPLEVIAGEAAYPDSGELLDYLKKFSRRVWTVEATDIALEMGNPIFSNMVIIGALSALDIEALPLRPEAFQEVLETLLPQAAVADNLAAFERGRQAVSRLD